MRRAKKVLHIVGGNPWRERLHFHGSTKDILNRRDYFKAREIEHVEIMLPARNDSACLERLKSMDLRDFDAVITEHPRYPDSLLYLKKEHPHIVRIIRGHNAELVHQLQTAFAYLRCGFGTRKWRFQQARQSARHAFQRFRFDLLCAHRSDYVLAISEWEAQRYWSKITDRRKILVCPYFLPEDHERSSEEAVRKARTIDNPARECVCVMSAQWSSLAHDAAKTLVRLIRASTTQHRNGWKFLITGDPGPPGAADSIRVESDVELTGRVANPFEIMVRARAMAHLSNLGLGFKTKFLDFIECGGWILVPRKLYLRQPEEIQPYCLVVDPVTPERFFEVLESVPAPRTESVPVNDRLRARAFDAMDQAFGYWGATAKVQPGPVALATSELEVEEAPRLAGQQ
jgi:hypothetical protein